MVKSHATLGLFCVTLRRRLQSTQWHVRDKARSCSVWLSILVRFIEATLGRSDVGHHYRRLWTVFDVVGGDGFSMDFVMCSGSEGVEKDLL